MGMIGRRLGVLRNCGAQHFSRLDMAAFLMGEDAQPVQAVGMGWLQRQDAAVELPGFRKMAIAMALNCGVKQRADTCLRPCWTSLIRGAALLAVHRTVSRHPGA